ncbi:MAG: hypothetical protein WC359_15405 [Dehalococcoidia bacterium]|jgi:hypothetical protein
MDRDSFREKLTRAFTMHVYVLLLVVVFVGLGMVTGLIYWPLGVVFGFLSGLCAGLGIRFEK